MSNLIIKLRRSEHRLLDNSNIKAYHLGKKGLHLNKYGTRKIASNIISLIKRLQKLDPSTYLDLHENSSSYANNMDSSSQLIMLPDTGNNIFPGAISCAKDMTANSYFQAMCSI